MSGLTLDFVQKYKSFQHHLQHNKQYHMKKKTSHLKGLALGFIHMRNKLEPTCLIH